MWMQYGEKTLKENLQDFLALRTLEFRKDMYGLNLAVRQMSEMRNAGLQSMPNMA